MENQDLQETILDQTDSDANEFDPATEDDEAATIESGIDPDAE